MAVPDAGVSTRAVTPLVAGLVMHGVDIDATLARVKLDPSTLADPDARVPHRQVIQLWELAPKLSGQPCFGLNVAAAMDLGQFDVQSYAFLSSRNLGEGLERIAHYQRLNHDAARLSLHHDGDLRSFRHELPGEFKLPRAAAEFLLGVIARSARAATEDRARIEAVHFQAPHDPERDEVYEEFFATRLRFAQPYNEIVFSAETLKTPHAKADPGLASVLDRHAALMLERLPKVNSVADRVRSLLAKELQGGNPGAEHIAEQLGLSPRTLARRLAAESSSHKALLEELRTELAQRYLKDPQLSIAEVAFLLGFSEPSAFHRAFKRWTSKTPAQYRRELA